jgi:hypothetical protein
LGKFYSEEGLLLRQRSGLILQRDDGGHWQLDAEPDAERLLGSRVRVEGVRSAFNSLDVSRIVPCRKLPSGGDEKMAAGGKSAFRWDARTLTLAAAAVAGAIALTLTVVAWRDIQRATELRERGIVTTGKLIRQESTTSSDSGPGVSTHYGVWSYSVNGRHYEIWSRGNQYRPTPEALPRLGPIRDGQIVYLMDDPAVARLRTEIAADTFGPLAGGSFFLVISPVFAGCGFFLLKRSPQA